MAGFHPAMPSQGRINVPASSTGPHVTRNMTIKHKHLFVVPDTPRCNLVTSSL